MSDGADVVVLGAGIVGTSAAIYLQRAGFATVLLDRRGAGEETSYGNAGLIQREGLHPYLMPRNLLRLLRYGLNRSTDVHYHPNALPSVAPFLLRYWLHSGAAGARQTFAANVPLFARCLEAHDELARAAGADALIARKGWIRIFRHDRASAIRRSQVDELTALGLDAGFISMDELSVLEPDLDRRPVAAAIHYRDPWTVNDPEGLTKAYLGLFVSEGGRFVTGDAMNARRDGRRWKVDTADGGSIAADQIVVALGPWSADFLARHDVRIPLGVKRGYHRHYRPQAAAMLVRPVADDETGFVLAPMKHGIRLTSGAEFADLSAPKTPVQIERLLPRARELFPLGDPVESEAWMGARPVFPDMLPAICRVPGLAGAWLDTGHAHHGLTLGPVSGRLLAQIMSGQQPFCDPAPYGVQRFRGT